MRKAVAFKWESACAVFVAAFVIPLSLFAAPTAQAASAKAGTAAAAEPTAGSPGQALTARAPAARPAARLAAPHSSGGSTATVTPASGPAGTTVSGSGANWTPGDHIQAEWGDDYSNLGNPVVVAGDGTFTDSFAIPSDATSGSHQVLFWDEEGRFFEVANFDVSGAPPPPPPSCNPAVSLTPDSGPVGSQFVVAGAGWSAGGTVGITLPYGSPGIFYASTWTPTVGADGSWQFTATVGKSPVGSYTFTFTETGCASQTATFTVGAAPPPPPSCNPSVSIKPGSGPVGSQFVMAGAGWAAGGTMKITLPNGSKGVFYASDWTPTVAADGTWQVNVTVGKSPIGGYTSTFAEAGCASQTGTFTVVAPPTPASCSKVWIIGARGSSEKGTGNHGMGPEVDHIASVLTADLKAKGQATQLLPVFYPADSVSDLLPDKQVMALILAGQIAAAIAEWKATSVAAYDASIESGVTGTEQEVASVLRLCPHARLVLAGYSQGAMAIHDAENWLAVHAPGELQHVLGTLLLGDGDRAPITDTKAEGKSEAMDFGTAPASAKGVRVRLYLAKAQAVPLPRSTASIANKNDIVADFAWKLFISPGAQAAVDVHTHYAYVVKVNGKATMVYDKALAKAADWVAAKVLAGV